MSIYSVTEITRYIKELFDGSRTLRAVFVRGEISNFKRHYSGHCYFTLKDNGATIRAVMFKSKAQFVKFNPVDGLKVVAGGYVTVFERDGQYQLYVEQLLPEGIGELSLAFAQLKDKLAAEGLFDENRKQRLPLLPRTVGVITSPAGAALRDIVTVAKRRHAGVRLCLLPVLVQGPEAPRQIVNALNFFNESYPVDVIIAGRGGGSIEELWAFNDEAVVRGIAASKIPVVSAVGHQTDYTLADFAADVRAATPSQAAELVVPDARELFRYVGSLGSALETGIRNTIQNKRSRLEQSLQSRGLTQPLAAIDVKRQLVDASVQRLEEVFSKGFTSKQHQFKVEAQKLAMLNPLAVLGRGYGIIRSRQGRIIHKVTETAPGQQLEAVLRDGIIQLEVVGVKEDLQ